MSISVRKSGRNSEQAVYYREISLGPEFITPHGKIGIAKIALLLQQLASEHYFSAGETFQSMNSEGRIWILTKIEITFCDSAFIGQQLAVKTWSRAFLKGKAYREFLFTANEQVVLKAQTEWIHFDLKNLKQLHLDKDIIIDFPQYNNTNFHSSIAEWHPEILQKISTSISYPLRYNDFDILHHMNNTRYFEFIEDFCYKNKYVPTNIKHRFRKEISLGTENISIEINEHTGNSFLYQFKKEEMVCAIGECQFENL